MRVEWQKRDDYDVLEMLREKTPPKILATVHKLDWMKEPKYRIYLVDFCGGKDSGEYSTLSEAKSVALKLISTHLKELLRALG